MNDKLKHIKQSGFKAPDDYFNNLEDAVFHKLNAKSKLVAPLGKDLRSPFGVKIYISLAYKFSLKSSTKSTAFVD